MKSKFYTRFAIVFTTILMFTYFATAQTTISVPVADALDDVEEYQQAKSDSEPAGFMDQGSSDLELCNETEGVQQVVGIIFRSVAIPVGATITNAYIQFCADSDNDEAITLDIWGAKAATVDAPWTDVPYSVSSLPKTALVQWTPSPWTTEMADAMAQGPEQQTPDIKTIIQEIIEVAGWASGNNICIALMDPSGTVKQHREAESFEGATDDNAGVGIPTLNVTFSGGTSVNPTLGEFSSIYPNPTVGILNIDNPAKDGFSFEIYTINGKLVARRHNLRGARTEVDLSSFAKGVYFVNVISAEKTETHKLILK